MRTEWGRVVLDTGDELVKKMDEESSWSFYELMLWNNWSCYK